MINQNIISKYDFFVVNDTTAQEHIDAIPKEKLAKYSPLDAAKHWINTTKPIGKWYIIGDFELGKQIVENMAITPADADFLLVLNDAHEIDISNLTHKQMVLACNEYNDENRAKENKILEKTLETVTKHSLSAYHLAHGGKVHFFGKPWPFYYAYLKAKLGTNIMLIETNEHAAKGAQLNNLEHIILS